MYFRNYFIFGTVINGENVSRKTVEEVTQDIEAKIQDYTLELEGRNDLKEQIKASDIGLKFNSKEEIQKIKDSQNPFAWISGVFKSNKGDSISEVGSYDEKLLKDKVDKLAYFDEKNSISPKNASINYKDGKYVIEEESYGSKANKDVVYENIVKAIGNNEDKLNLENIKCYEDPKYTSKSTEVEEAKNTLNKYIQTKITYTIGGNTETLDGSEIHQWLQVDDNFQVTINENKVKAYVNDLGYRYNTTGRTREFATSTGKTLKIDGGNYGWRINSSEEQQAILEAVKQGQAITKEPNYSQKAVSHDANDIGKTYVEINFTKQHMWFYKDGALVTQGDVVTGNVNNGWATPTGIYRLAYKEKNATLKGEGYETPVSFWMPFNGGIGIHDATWRNEFGKDLYIAGGSHGCVNSPYEVAQTIFENIQPGTPIVCYYE